MIRAAFLAVAALAGTAVTMVGQTPLALAVEEGTPRLVVGGVLDDPALADAVRSGLPLRMRFRLELWRDGLFDALEGEETWTAVLAYEPLEQRFITAGSREDSVGRFAEYERAREALERTYTAVLGPEQDGRYYYLAFLEVETLSLSDLDELERWLRGDLEPAFRGNRSLAQAIGTGLKRLLVRVLGLPARRWEARSDAFDVP